MSLKQNIEKIKSYLGARFFILKWRNWLIYSLIFIIIIDSFIIGQIINIKKESITFKKNAFNIEFYEKNNKVGNYGASINGTKYYLTTCSGFNRIKEENKIYFNNTEEAQKAGYEAASNCSGL